MYCILCIIFSRHFSILYVLFNEFYVLKSTHRSLCTIFFALYHSILSNQLYVWMLCILFYALYSVHWIQCITFPPYIIFYLLHYNICNVLFALYYILFIVFCALFFHDSILFIVFYALYYLRCILLIIFVALYTMSWVKSRK